jgi:lipoate-protein ligase B
MIDYQTTGDLTHTEVRAQKVERKIDPALPVEKTGVETAGKTKAPNEARKGAGLPIPMATMGEDGKVVEQWVSYKDADR